MNVRDIISLTVLPVISKETKKKFTIDSVSDAQDGVVIQEPYFVAFDQTTVAVKIVTNLPNVKLPIVKLKDDYCVSSLDDEYVELFDEIIEISDEIFNNSTQIKIKDKPGKIIFLFKNPKHEKLWFDWIIVYSKVDNTYLGVIYMESENKSYMFTLKPVKA